MGCSASKNKKAVTTLIPKVPEVVVPVVPVVPVQEIVQEVIKEGPVVEIPRLDESVLDFSPYSCLETISNYLEVNKETLASVTFYKDILVYKAQVLAQEIDNLRWVTQCQQLWEQQDQVSQRLQ